MTLDDYDRVIPDASAMFESMRAYGYTTEAAIADIIDNSLSAGAKKITIDFHWAGKNSIICITDDGHGMNEDELVNAMKPGSRNPLEEREPKDLGRFGLGLKTASLSQCRTLTVGSKRKGNEISVRRWDLDHIRKVRDWQLLRSATGSGESVVRQLTKVDKGTIVIWQNLDRIVGKTSVDDHRAEERFLEMIDRVEEHLAMVFHRFLDAGRDGISIYINGEQEDRRVRAWDPFMEWHPATHIEPEERIPCGRQSIVVTGFVLPHKDKLTDDDYAKGTGVKGWNSQQGFYIYRNRRLLVAGDWLNLGTDNTWKKDEQFKLARIRLDLPNSMDQDWQIDVKKSTAKPPAEVRQRLTELGKIVRDRALSVFVHRGEYGPRERRSDISRIWQSEGKGRRRYRIDRSHPLVKEVFDIEPKGSKRVKTLLRILEETVPIEQIWLDMAGGTVSTKRFENDSDEKVEEYILQIYRAIVRQEGRDPEATRTRMMNMDAFMDHRDLIAKLELPKKVD